jgi:hypothetical protein
MLATDSDGPGPHGQFGEFEGQAHTAATRLPGLRHGNLRRLSTATIGTPGTAIGLAVIHRLARDMEGRGGRGRPP